uniref:Jacalin-type lectin domain-containing protein n=1 Tax=Leersia perrieri TaxID=77586 RepID=A0A0D9WCN2_9ORYZ
MECLAKIGPWGGGGGDPQDIAGILPPPHRVVSIEVSSGGAVDALSFTYAAIDGTKHTVGPSTWWTVGPWGPHGCVVTSLAFVTGAGKRHGPFGEGGGGGEKFRVPVRGRGRVVGFFVRSGWLIDAVGVYVHP